MQRKTIVCTTYARNIDDTLIQAREKLVQELNGQVVQGFRAIIYFDDNATFSSFPSSQRVDFFVQSDDSLEHEDFGSRISRQCGEIELSFHFHSKSFLSNREDVESFTKNLSVAIIGLYKHPIAGIWLIFRACRMRSISCSKFENDLIITRIVFEDLDALKLKWSDSLSLSGV